MSSRDRILIAVLATVAVLGGYWFAALKPKRAELAETRTQVVAATKQRDAARAEVAAAMNARRSFAEHYREVVRLGKAVPVGDQIPSLIYQIEESATKARVDVNSIAPNGAAPGVETAAPAQPAAPTAAPAAAGVFESVPFAFEFTGDFFDLERFLSTLEKHTTTTAGDRVVVRGRLLTLDSLSLTAAQDGKRLTATIGATTYALPADEGATNGATPSGPAPATPGAATPPPAGGASSTSTTASVQGVTP